MKKLIFALASTIFLVSCAHNGVSDQKLNILPVAKVKWEKLNPARGDKSPQAGTLWGDRKGKQETGFLAKFVDGFSSPPHIHNVSYRAIVIEGLIHNDDPTAQSMWMPQGSYWTQPAGEAHITSAKGKRNIALVEIDNGPYLVKPTNQKFDNGQRPYNIHASNIIWKEREGYEYVELWQNNDGVVTGSLIKFDNQVVMKASQAKVVVISGNVTIADRSLGAGSLVSVDDTTNLEFSCKSQGCILYLKSVKNFKIN